MIRAEEQSPGIIKLWNHTFHEPSRFAKATFDKECRQTIQDSDLICLDQCHYQVEHKSEGYHGSIEPGCRCMVTRNGQETVLVSTFHLQEDSLKTLDRGHDPKTNARLWGAIAGEFQFKRTKSWEAKWEQDIHS